MNGYNHDPSQKSKGSLFMEPSFFEAPQQVDWREKGYVTHQRPSKQFIKLVPGAYVYVSLNVLKSECCLTFW